jgi:hypothetical protein
MRGDPLYISLHDLSRGYSTTSGAVCLFRAISVKQLGKDLIHLS